MSQEFPIRTIGKIVSVQQFGALVELVDTKEVGILHISKISERFISDVQKFLIPGEQIRVDNVNRTNNRIELSIKDIPHYRNLGSSHIEDFDMLVEALPSWIDEKIQKKNRMENK